MSPQPEGESKADVHARVCRLVVERAANATSPEEVAALWEALDEYTNHLLDQNNARMYILAERQKRQDKIKEMCRKLIEEKIKSFPE